jgi:hypothetical protein
MGAITERQVVDQRICDAIRATLATNGCSGQPGDGRAVASWAIHSVDRSRPGGPSLRRHGQHPSGRRGRRAARRRFGRCRSTRPRRCASISNSRFWTAIAVSVSQNGTAQLSAISRPCPALSASEYREVCQGRQSAERSRGTQHTFLVSANHASASVVCQNLATASPDRTTKWTPWLYPADGGAGGSRRAHRRAADRRIPC